jgi:transcriptional regulator with XRE-family HTH domain
VRQDSTGLYKDGLGFLAGIVDVDPAYLSRVLRGKQQPSWKLLRKLESVIRETGSGSQAGGVGEH